MNAAERALRSLLLKQVGKPYIFGFEVRLSDPDPRAFDCSELVQWSFYRRGVTIPDGSFNQYPKTVAISGSPLVGDLFFLKNANGRVYHVGVCIGNGEVVEARSRRYGVVKTTVSGVRARGGIWRRYPPMAKKLRPAGVTRPYPGYVLKRGASGPDVTWVQKRLMGKGYKLPKYGDDGDFGDETYAAVKRFREAVFTSRPQLGNVGPKTWERLAR